MYILWFVSIYTVIVLSMVLAHMFLTDYLNSYDKRIRKKAAYWSRVMERCSITKNHKLKKSEVKKFGKPQYVSAFYKCQKERKREAGLLLEYNANDLIKVIRKKRSETQKAYFSYILSEFSDDYEELPVAYAEVMLDFLILNSVYLRENSLRVLYKIGTPELIGEAFKRLSANGISHSKKLLTDGLMLFKKDKTELITYLMGQIEHYAECYQVAIVNHMVYEDFHDCDMSAIALLTNTQSVDLKCSVLRLLGKKICEEHKLILLANIKLDAEESNWETAAVAARLLGEYCGDKQVEEALEESVRARNWYVRVNSAESISRIYQSDEQIADILNGNDKYAAEALAYALKSRESEI